MAPFRVATSRHRQSTGVDGRRRTGDGIASCADHRRRRLRGRNRTVGAARVGRPASSTSSGGQQRCAGSRMPVCVAGRRVHLDTLEALPSSRRSVTPRGIAAVRKKTERLPREASPAKVAKDGQHDDDDDDDPKPGRHVILSLGTCRFYRSESPRTFIGVGSSLHSSSVPPLRARARRSSWCGPRSTRRGCGSRTSSMPSRVKDCLAPPGGG